MLLYVLALSDFINFALKRDSPRATSPPPNVADKLQFLRKAIIPPPIILSPHEIKHVQTLVVDAPCVAIQTMLHSPSYGAN